MKYYSEKLSKANGKAAVFDTEDELLKAEKEHDEKHALEERKAEERKADAKLVSDAYKHSLDVRRKAAKDIAEADKAYRDELSSFIGKHGSYHMTFAAGDDFWQSSFGELWDDFFDRLFL